MGFRLRISWNLCINPCIFLSARNFRPKIGRGDVFSRKNDKISLDVIWHLGGVAAPRQCFPRETRLFQLRYQGGIRDFPLWGKFFSGCVNLARFQNFPFGKICNFFFRAISLKRKDRSPSAQGRFPSTTRRIPLTRKDDSPQAQGRFPFSARTVPLQRKDDSP